MRKTHSHRVILANGAAGPGNAADALVLHYLRGQPGRRLNVGLPRFVLDASHIPDRTLDLLEIASYVFAADRSFFRGPKDAVEYHRWSRSMEFHIRVRDYEFWRQEPVREELCEALKFLTGDSGFAFHFEPGHSTPPTGLFDTPESLINPGPEELAVTLFSGGIDSLAGALELLESRHCRVLLVSHQSKPGATRTRRQLVDALRERYGGRLSCYEFGGTLTGDRAADETQRTRSFLYTSIAFAIASVHKQHAISVFENGVTSINLHRREDLVNARASRTTHPQAMGRLSRFLSLLAGDRFCIDLPFLYRTKADVIQVLQSRARYLMSSTVSCSKTFQVKGGATHCGQCFQCIDRRIAAHSASAEELDHRGLYTHDVIRDPIADREARTVVVDYIRQAMSCARGGVDAFQSAYLSELADLIDYLPGRGGDADKVTTIWDLYRRHGAQVKQGLERMRSLYEDLYEPLPPDSLLGLVALREHLKPEVIRLAQRIAAVACSGIHGMFANGRLPKNERDLNQKLGALLRTHDSKLRSEHPTVSFACAGVVPDHSLGESDLLVEAKYIRQATSPSKATDGIASDLTKYPTSLFILFVVYDPERRIADDDAFRREIEGKGRNIVLIVR
jgi:7-cyano-7-deazaguanine synthase in queuosine biosynthesis